MITLGTQIAVDLYDCDSTVDLNDVDFVGACLLRAAKAGDATIVTDCFHHFSPHGVSGVVVIAESHIAIHTWPEYQFAAVDIFTCGDSCDPEKMRLSLLDSFKAQRCEVQQHSRGAFPSVKPSTYTPEPPITEDD